VERKRLIVTDSWLGGTYFDWWMVVHFLGGFVIELGLLLFGMSVAASSLATFVLLVLWEVYERAVNIYEPRANQVIDIIFGVLGLVVGLQMFQLFDITSSTTIFFIAALLWIILTIWGWKSWRKRIKSLGMQQ